MALTIRTNHRIHPIRFSCSAAYHNHKQYFASDPGQKCLCSVSILLVSDVLLQLQTLKQKAKQNYRIDAQQILCE